MKRPTRIFGLALTIAGAAASATTSKAAQADSTDGGARLPASYTARPLILPGMTAEADAGFAVFKLLPTSGSFKSDPFVGVHLGGAFGITDDFQVDATLLPLLLSPRAEYGNPSIGATYRFTDGDFEVGARVRVFLPARKGTDLILTPGVPVLLRLGTSLRLDTGVNFLFAFTKKTQVAMAGITDLLSYDPGIPVKLTAQVTDELAVGGGTGLGVLNFDFAGDTLFIPLSAHGVFTIPTDDGAPFVDVGAQFGFPFFLTPGSRFDAVNPDVFFVGLTGKGYFYL